MGIVIGPIILAYFLIAALIATFVKPPKWKWGILALYVAIPFGDHFLGWLYFRYHCAVTAGQHVYRTVDGVDGFSIDTRYPEDYLNGYLYIEGKGKNDEKIRISYDDHRNFLIAKVDEYTSNYHVYWRDKFSFYKIVFHELVVSENDSILAKQVTVQYLGGWIFDLVGGGGFKNCRGNSTDYLQFFKKVLNTD